MIKLIISTFLFVFLAELGDKTQLTTMMLAAKSENKAAIFIGSSLALVCASLVGVLLGSVISKYIPENIIHIAAAIAFIIIGILILFNKI